MARSVSGHILSGESARQILLNCTSYNESPNNTVTFVFRAVSSGGNHNSGSNTETPSNSLTSGGTTIITPPQPPASGEIIVDPPSEYELPEQVYEQLDTEQTDEPAPADESLVADANDNTSSDTAADSADESTRMVTYSLSQIGNTSGEAINNLSIISRPSQTLKLYSGEIPAFSFGEGITYTILFRTAYSPANQVLASGVSASEPFHFYNTTGEVWTETTLLFNSVPGRFAQGNTIHYTFELIGDYYYHEYGLFMNLPHAEQAAHLNNLEDQIAILANLIATSTNPEFIAKLSMVLEDILKVFYDPYATSAQILSALATIDSVVTEAAAYNNIAPGFSLGYLGNLLPLLGGILLSVVAFASFILKKKKQRAYSFSV
jgi:hypothetical protein